MVCWVSEGQDSDHFGIFGQIYDNSGTKIGEEFKVNTFTPHVQWKLGVCGLSNGGFVACWQSGYYDIYNHGIYAQLFDNSYNKFGY